jgi:hypothetical protein
MSPPRWLHFALWSSRRSSGHYYQRANNHKLFLLFIAFSSFFFRHDTVCSRWSGGQRTLEEVNRLYSAHLDTSQDVTLRPSAPSSLETLPSRSLPAKLLLGIVFESRPCLSVEVAHKLEIL